MKKQTTKRDKLNDALAALAKGTDKARKQLAGLADLYTAVATAAEAEWAIVVERSAHGRKNGSVLGASALRRGAASAAALGEMAIQAREQAVQIQGMLGTLPSDEAEATVEVPTPPAPAAQPEQPPMPRRTRRTRKPEPEPVAEPEAESNGEAPAEPPLAIPA